MNEEQFTIHDEKDYNSQKFKYAKEIMKEKNINIFDIDWNKFKTKEEIKEFIEMLENLMI